MLKRVSVESILVMFLFILFTASIGLLIVEGQEAFGNIVDNKNNNEDIRIGVSYVNMKVKQNNISGNIQLIESPYSELNALEIRHYGEEEGYVTYIVYDEGALYECYQDRGDPINKELGEVIVKLKAEMNFELDQSNSLLNIIYDKDIILSIEVFGLEEIND